MDDFTIEPEAPIRSEASLLASSFLLFVFVAMIGWVFFHGRMPLALFDGVPDPLSRFAYWIFGGFLVSYLPLRFVAHNSGWPFPRATTRARFRVLLGLAAAGLAFTNFLYELVSR
jgi:hypothetical protein